MPKLHETDVLTQPKTEDQALVAAIKHTLHILGFNSPDPNTPITCEPSRWRLVHDSGLIVEFKLVKMMNVYIIYAMVPGGHSPIKHHMRQEDFVRRCGDFSWSRHATVAGDWIYNLEKLYVTLRVHMAARLLNHLNNELPVLYGMPTSVLSIIASFLPVASVCATGRICQALVALAKEDEVWYPLLKRDFPTLHIHSRVNSRQAYKAHHITRVARLRAQQERSYMRYMDEATWGDGCLLGCNRRGGGAGHHYRGVDVSHLTGPPRLVIPRQLDPTGGLWRLGSEDGLGILHPISSRRGGGRRGGGGGFVDGRGRGLFGGGTIDTVAEGMYGW